MEVEIHQLELRYASLRVMEPKRQSRLMASLAREDQQSPVLVVAGEAGVYVLIDGYRRVEALQSLGRDKVDATVLQVTAAEALLLTWRMEAAIRRSALEEGWLLQELIETEGVRQVELTVRLSRSKSWISRRLSLVEILPESAQEGVRRGRIPAYAAAKYLVPLARANSAHCVGLVANLGGDAVSVRQVERLYVAWRNADEEEREKIISHPWLFLKAEEAAVQTPGDEVTQLVSDLEAISGLTRKVRSRLRKGVLAQALKSGADAVEQSWKETHIAFEALTKHIHKEGLRA